MRPISTLIVGLIILVSCAPPPDNSADVIIYNAKVYIGSPEGAMMGGLTIHGERITHIGSTDKAVLKLKGEHTRLIDAGGKLVLPGFNDAHLHFLAGGYGLASVDLRYARTPKAFTAMIEEYAQELHPGAWITGGNWDHTHWGGELPSREWIDAVTPNNPVWIDRLDGHMALANTAALKAAGVDRDVDDIEGGTIVRDANGDLTGILKDNAMWLVNRVVPDASLEQEDQALQAAMEYVNSQGVTSVQHMGSWNDLAVFRRAHQSGKMNVRISAAVPLSTWERLAAEVSENGMGDEWLKIGALKGFVDGSLGSHTALFREPYSDQPKDIGLQVTSYADLFNWSTNADAAGLQVVTHAIGDSAIHLLLDIYQQVDQENGPRDRRFRCEHSQHIHPDDIARFAELQVVPSMQPYHCIDDGRWAEPLIGSKRCETTYAFRSLLDTGSRPAFGSDWPVAPATPLEGIYAAVTRRTLDDKHPQGWYPDQKISVAEAVAAYTQDAAYASFEEDLKGTLEPGKLADVVILDRDIFEIPPEQIKDVEVSMTIVGGRVVYSANE
jgi:predicted amidohydrolase YtcJ